MTDFAPRTGGDCAAAVRAADWADTPLGPVGKWPPDLRVALGIVLDSAQPMLLVWGPERILLYNDAYLPILGAARHPWAMGKPTSAVWPEIWDQIAPLFDRVSIEGAPVWVTDQLLMLERGGFPEECYFDFSFSAVRDEAGRVGGTFVACTETTGRVLGARRLAVLRDVAARIAPCRTVSELRAAVELALADDREDVPYAYLHVPELGELPVLDEGRALALPVGSPDGPGAFLVAGVSPRRPLDDEYRGFFDSLAAQIRTALQTVRLTESEQQSRERLRLALAAAGMGTWEFDVAARRVAWSPELEALHGFAPGTFDGTIEQYLADIHPDDVARVRAAVEAAPRTGQLRVEYRVVMPDGAVRWREARGSALHDDRGRVVALQGVCLDATDRAEAEAERARLYAAERLAREVAERVQQHLAVRDAVGAVLTEAELDDGPRRVLEVVCEGLGWDWGAFWEVDAAGEAPVPVATWASRGVDARPFEAATRAIPFLRGRGLPGRVWACGRPVWVADVGRDRGFARRAAAAAAGLRSGLALPVRSSGRVVAVLELLAGEVRRRDRELLATLAAIGSKVGQFVERRRAEGALRLSEARFRELFEDAPVGYQELDAEGRFVRVNKALCGMLGYTAEELLGRRIWELEWAHGESSEETRRKFLEKIATGDRWTQVERVRVRKDGSLLPVWVDDRFVHDAAGRVVGLRSAQVDISARKAAEAERDRLLADERAARVEAEAAVRARDEFVATVSHDLGNPLAAIKGHVQLMRRRARRGEALDASQLDDRLATVEGAAADMDRLIGDLLDAARLQAGRPLHLRLGPVDLVALARDCMATYAQSSDVHRFRFGASVPSAVGEWDAARVQRVVANLLSNAVKYSPDGGDVDVAVGIDGARALLTVRDQGLGIPAADLPHVFERFRRGSNVAERVPGTGIGLAGAKEIVELHGGTITVESAEGHGTTVTLRLPLAATDHCRSD